MPLVPLRWGNYSVKPFRLICLSATWTIGIVTRVSETQQVVSDPRSHLCERELQTGLSLQAFMVLFCNAAMTLTTDSLYIGKSILRGLLVSILGILHLLFTLYPEYVEHT